MKKTAIVFAGLALSSICLAGPVTGGVQGSGAVSPKGGVSGDAQLNAQGKGLNSVELERRAPSALQGTESDDASAAVFTALDRNGDGKLDKAEAKAERSLNQQFSVIDVDANGTVSREEYFNRQDAIRNLEEEAE
ncbi:hypothetical protein [Zhongshania sp.]|uniref:hypothetical protein n=1 Tax=Zhongshania sp. TaxID=1971902 RepID=UPI0035697EC5